MAHWDWVLYHFRLPFAHALRRRGYEVVFVCPFGEWTPRLQALGFRCVPWSVCRRSVNPLRELLAVWRLAHIYRAEQPDLIQHFTIKPNLYGSLAARLVRWKASGNGQGRAGVVNTFTGLGFLFTSHPLARLLRAGLSPVLRWALAVPNSRTVFLNLQDLRTFVRLRLVSPERAHVLADGVDAQRFRPPERPLGDATASAPIVLMACRLLWDKGVGEFVDAARLLQQRGVAATFWLAGSPDPGNPTCIPDAALSAWQREGVIQWLGHRGDMAELLRQVDIAVLPSYHEGASRFLQEAAATGLPLVATDIDGCRALVCHGVNGLVVPPKSAMRLADALETLLNDTARRQDMGKASRAMALQQSSEASVTQQYLDLYRDMGLVRVAYTLQPSERPTEPEAVIR